MLRTATTEWLGDQLADFAVELPPDLDVPLDSRAAQRVLRYCERMYAAAELTPPIICWTISLNCCRQVSSSFCADRA